jgi:hypothetical protein
LFERASVLCYTYIACLGPHLIHLIPPSVCLLCETSSKSCKDFG